MAEKYPEYECNEIVEKPIDFFYANWTQTISLDFQNLPNIESKDVETWTKFLDDLWEQHFTEKNISDFLKYCTYYTGLVGQFYKINYISSLDNLYILLNDRLPNPDSYYSWNELHKFARTVLTKMCKNSAADISLILDCHFGKQMKCDNSGRMTLLLNDLPANEERCLVYHITIVYNRHDEYKSTNSSSTSSNLKSEAQDSYNKKDRKDEIEDSKELKSSASPKQMHTSSDSKNTDPWQKYGAKPKSKQLQKSYSIPIESHKEDSYKSTSCADPRLSEDYRRARNRPRATDDLDRTNKTIENQGSRSLSFPPPKIMENVKPFSTSSAPTEIDNFTDLEYRRQSRNDAVPPHSSSSSALPKDTGYLRNLIEESSVSEKTISESKSIPPRRFTQTPEHDLLCEKFGARIDEHGNRRCCKPNDTRTGHKANEILQSRRRPVTKDESGGDIDSACVPDFSQMKDLNDLFKTEKELEEMPEGMREVQKTYELVIIDMMKSSVDESKGASSCSERLTEAERDEYFPVKTLSIVTADESSGHTDTICVPDFSQMVKDIENVLQCDKELAEITDEMKECQKILEKDISMTSSKSESRVPSSGNEKLSQEERGEQFLMQAPAPRYKQKAPEISFTPRQINEDYLLCKIRNFFKNYQFTNLDITPSSSHPIDFCDKVSTSDFLNQATALIHKKQDSRHLVVKTSDKVWKHNDPNNEQGMEKFNQNLEVISADATGDVSKSENEFLGGVPDASEFSAEMIDSCFQSCIQKLTDSVSEMSLDRAESLPFLSDEINPQACLDDDLLNCLTEVSSNLDSDSDDSLGSVSELEDNDKAS